MIISIIIFTIIVILIIITIINIVNNSNHYSLAMSMAMHLPEFCSLPAERTSDWGGCRKALPG